MKRAFRILALLLALSTVLCMTTVFASAEETGTTICKITLDKTKYKNVSLTAQSKDGTVYYTSAYIDDNKEQAICCYKGVIKFLLTLTTSNTTDDFMVFMLEGDTVPKDGNIVYLNQAEGSANQSFVIYPSQLTTGKTYNIYVSSAKDGFVPVASLYVPVTVEDAEFMIGDVVVDNKVNLQDAMWVLQECAYLHEESPTAEQIKRADTNFDNKITIADALLILQYVGYLIKGF